MQGLNFSYGDQPVLENIDLTISRGDCVAFLGPNGGGKTTLVKLCLGLLAPSSGKLKVLGRDAAQGLPPVLGRIGYVPQDINPGAGFPISALDLVLTGRLKPGGGRWGWSRADHKAARLALERMGLWDRRHGRVDTLSGGQRQRLMIARALAGEPELLFLDEPTASLDRQWQTLAHDLFKDLNKSVTIVLVSHDISVIASHIKSVACINQVLHYHPRPEITADMLSQTYQCPIELIAHGLPHRVLAEHGSESNCQGDQDA